MGVETRHRRKRRKSTGVESKAKKYRTSVLGLFLLLVGFGSILMTLDFKFDTGSAFKLSSYKDLLSMWPLILTGLGFLFVIYDYIKNSSKQKYK